MESWGRLSAATIAAGPVIQELLFMRFTSLKYLARYSHRVLAIAMLGSASPLLAQDSFDAAKFDRLIAAGEFAPAQNLAGTLADSSARDARLAELAAAQQAAGLVRQANRTAGTIRSSDSFNTFLAQELPGGFLPGAGSGGAGAGGFLPPGAGMGMGRGGRGGGVQADFDPLIELIQSTVAPDTWEDLGGTGRMQEFEAGVHVDPSGRLERVLREDAAGSLSGLRAAAERGVTGIVEQESMLRMISLPRLERAVRARLAQGLEPTDEMKYLAGIRRIEAVFVYPETGDLVIAGPAGAWSFDSEARAIHTDTGTPVLVLDDLVDCLRALREGDGYIGCSIDPRPENLQATQQYLAEHPGSGKRWQEGLRAALGTQVITITGLQPDSHAAFSIVAADYHMKLVGMGLEPGVAGVEDVLTLIANEDERPRDTSVIRWWFSLNYDEVVTTADHSAFRLVGSATRVLSENEHLEETGERVHTGRSDGPTTEFAQSFSAHFEQLCQKYPVYGDLRNVFDLAMVAGLIDRYDLDEQVSWDGGCFGRRGANGLTYTLESFGVPREVETVMNVKEITRRANGRTTRETLLGVSGGVQANVRDHVSSRELVTDNYQLLDARRVQGQPDSWDSNQWWWD